MHDRNLKSHWIPSIATLTVLAAMLAAPWGAQAQRCAGSAITGTGKVPLPDLGLGTYLGFSGGLYPEGRPNRPSDHLAAGVEIATNQIQPLDSTGLPDPENGKIVMISVGISNTKMMFAGSGGPSNVPVSFMSRVIGAAGNNPHLLIVNGAQGGAAAEEWIEPNAEAWENIDQFLSEAGASPEQVQVAWIKLTARGGNGPFPGRAIVAQGYFEAIARNLFIRYPGIRLAYFSTRTFSVSPIPKSPEPTTYEDGFAVKWMIERQIRGDLDLNYDPDRGDVMAPWLSWGPYLWTDGLNARSDGLVWSFDDQGCGVHPRTAGVAKNAAQLYAFFLTDPTTTPWFLRETVVGQPPQVVAVSASPASGPAPLVVDFHASATDPDGQVKEIVWTFGDGTFSYNSAADPSDPLNLQNNPDPEKTYYTPGSYQAYVTILDDDGNAVTQTVDVTVVGEPVIRSFEVDEGRGAREPQESDQPSGAGIPVVISAEVISSTSIRLEWSGEALDRRGYKLERSSDGESGWTEIATVRRGVSSYLDEGLAPATNYYYRLRLSNAGDGIFSNVASAATDEAQLARGSEGFAGPDEVADPESTEGPHADSSSLSSGGLLLLSFAAGAAFTLGVSWFLKRRRRS